MERTITATELAKNLSDILNRVRYRGETFVVERNGDRMATIGPAGPSQHATLADVLADIGHLRVPDGLGDDLEAIQAAQPKAEFPTWDT